jgi:hypothetical protein
MINEEYTQNFNTLIAAVEAKRVCLMECKRKRDGEIVNLVCAINYDGDEMVMLPFAEMMTGDPFEDYYPPDPNGGFFEE